MKKVVDNAVFDLMDALRSPVLTHAQAWADVIPERMLKLIPAARLVNLIQSKETASDVEVVVFIYTRTMEAPMSSEWVDIYTHMSCKVLEQYFKEDHWKEVNAPRTISDYEINYYLKPLQKWIYERRRKALKERMKVKTESPRPVTCVADETEILPDIIDGHYALWNT